MRQSNSRSLGSTSASCAGGGGCWCLWPPTSSFLTYQYRTPHVLESRRKKGTFRRRGCLRRVKGAAAQGDFCIDLAGRAAPQSSVRRAWHRGYLLSEQAEPPASHEILPFGGEWSSCEKFLRITSVLDRNQRPVGAPVLGAPTQIAICADHVVKNVKNASCARGFTASIFCRRTGWEWLRRSGMRFWSLRMFAFQGNDLVVRVVPLRIRRDGIQQGSIAVVRSLTGCATAAPPPLEKIPR